MSSVPELPKIEVNAYPVTSRPSVTSKPTAPGETRLPTIEISFIGPESKVKSLSKIETVSSFDQDSNASSSANFEEKERSRKMTIVTASKTSQDAAAVNKKNGGKSTVGSRGTSKKVDDQMNYEHLLQLEEIFNEGTKGEEGLDMDQFRVAMKKTMGNDIDDTELDMIFMKVDNNCDGTVDWDEYLSYMLLEYQEKKNMFTLDQDCPFPEPMVKKPCNHIEPICSIRLLQGFNARHSESDGVEQEDSSSRYLTLSKEGILNVWNLNWVLQKTVTLDGGKGAGKTSNSPVGGLSVTDMVCMPNCNTIAVASTDYEISFYTMTSNMIQKRFQIRELKHCALTMDYSYNVKDPKKGILVWGDTNGSISVVRFYENPNLCLFNLAICPDGRVSMARLLRGELDNLKAARFRNAHSDWVQQVRYYVNRKGQECFISACAKDDKALFFVDITEKTRCMINRKLNVNRKSHFYVTNGVLSLAYDPEWNLIVTGGRDCDVRVWNPYVVSKSSAVLKGHNSAVLQVLVRSFDHQIISISKDKNIRVWDLRDYSCKQSIHGRGVDLGRLDIAGALFNERTKEMTIVTNRIGVFQPRNHASNSFSVKQSRSHSKPVATVLYNPLFNQLVTGGEDSMVCIWDIKTGVKQMQFCTGPEVEITCMAFDPTNRRLLTGGRAGGAILWNFNNGAKLRCLEKMDKQEITDIVFTRQRIVTAGWNRHVSVYLDSYGNDNYTLLKRTHDDDILCLDYHKHDGILVSSSYDGDVFIWSLETADIMMMFNMHLSLLPVHNRQKKRHIPKAKSKMKTESSAKMCEGKLSGMNNTSQSEIKGRKKRRSATTIGLFLKRSDVWLPSNLPWINEKNKTNYQFSDGEDIGSDFDTSTTTSPSNSVSQSSLGSASRSSRSSATQSDNPQSRITDKAIYKVLFLQTRNCGETTGSLVTSSAGGWISTWSVHQRGGMLGFFHACKRKFTGDFVSSLASDGENKVLVTGDSRGYVKVWDFENYCFGADVVERRSATPSEFDLHYIESNATARTNRYLPCALPPDLKASFRGHVAAVTSLTIIGNRDLIATGGVDGSVRLWSLEGRYIGTFGQSQPWIIDLPLQTRELPIAIPADIRRIGSPNTLRTIKGSVHMQWKQVKNAVNFLTMMGMPEKQPKKKPVPKAVAFMQSERVRRDSIEERLSKVGRTMIEEAAEGIQRQRRGSVTVWMQDIPHSLVSTPKPTDSVEDTFQRLQRTGMHSEILGKINYKPKQRHKQATVDTKIKWCNKHAVVYNSLPFQVLEPPSQPSMPEHIYKSTALRTTINAAQRKVMVTNALRKPPKKETGPQKPALSETISTAENEENNLKKSELVNGDREKDLRNSAGQRIVVKMPKLIGLKIGRRRQSQQPSPLISPLVNT